MKPARLLLVEDNPGDADLTREVLESSRLGLEIAVVPDGEQALAYLLRQAPFEGVGVPDLILLDLNLPRMDGRELLAEMAKHRDLGRIPIVVLTSSDAERDVVASYELGANCYVTKPVDLVAFQSIVQSVGDFWFGVAELP